MRLALISDTHMGHDDVVVPACDLVVHAGDFSRKGKRDEMVAFLSWFGRLPARAKVLTAGNHDTFVERFPDEARELARQHGVLLLLDEEVEIEGLRIYASPISPSFGSMAFNRDRGAPIRAHWDRIPSGLDLLVTHGPPKGLGDRIVLGMQVGCDDLLDRVRRVRPQMHVYGHIHEARGEYRLDDVPTRFLNVASQRLLWGGVRPAVVVELSPARGAP